MAIVLIKRIEDTTLWRVLQLYYLEHTATERIAFGIGYRKYHELHGSANVIKFYTVTPYLECSYSNINTECSVTNKIMHSIERRSKKIQA